MEVLLKNPVNAIIEQLAHTLNILLVTSSHAARLGVELLPNKLDYFLELAELDALRIRLV